MRVSSFIAELRFCGLLLPEQAAAIEAHERTRPFSLHYEIRTLLYLGITLLSGGLGVLLYEHLDHLGHGVVVALMALLTAACFAYAARHRRPFSWAQVPSAGLLPDYLLLLGCLLFLALEGYLQAQYTLFGTRYGLALVVPAVLFFYLAYRLDHRGVLSMGITALAAWAGLSVQPLSVFENQLLTGAVSRAAIGLGAALLVLGWLSETRRRKAHFAYTYLLLGGNLLLAAATAAMFGEVLRPAGLLILLILAVSAGLFWYGQKTHSHLFLLLGTAYGYVAFTFGLFLGLRFLGGEDVVFGLALYYFVASTAAAIWFLTHLKRLAGTAAHV
ncbi:DUF2157 domain-containing protein [Hymenobacter rubripertinctus]|uniref:DUF2157 domain-containing protein n=1 Tax=Hymenobacter rubripertinctus TaxID=2029981 RepID=A0A418R635_9BACT|nr:DUF2157 domain-containing protein [Hymenobacter rubripertinctus]RIY12765.1 DUF2157 domain-containing protein [Hymenobacter rubripertinctus]